jgi:hypothetical protein
MTEQRYRAVLEVHAGVPVTEVAERFGVSRQAVHRWIGWYREEGLDGLADRSHRPHAHPAQTSPEVEAVICQLRRTHPRWGSGASRSSWAAPAAPARSRRYPRSTGCWCATAWSRRCLGAGVGRTTSGGSGTIRWSCGRWTSSTGSGWPTGPRPRLSRGWTTTPGSAPSPPWCAARPAAPSAGHSRTRCSASGSPTRCSPSRPQRHPRATGSAISRGARSDRPARGLGAGAAVIGGSVGWRPPAAGQCRWRLRR